MTEQPIRVLIVDDQPMLRLGFRLVLDAEDGITVVGEAGDGAAGIALAKALHPDVVLMDVRMPGMDGIAATARLAQDAPTCRVIILTTFDIDEYAFAALRAGASGFLVKDAQAAELVDAVRAVARGVAVVAPRVTRRMLELFARQLPDADGAEAATSDPRLGLLTPREADIFGALGLGLSNAEIAARFVLSEATVKTHVAHVLRKLGLRDRVQAVVLAYETGVVGR